MRWGDIQDFCYNARMDRDEIRDRLLIATLPHVVFEGWRAVALAAGAADAGMDDAATLRYFPGGAPEMVAHFSAWADRRMIEAMDAHDIAQLRTRDRIALAIRLRFEALAPWREAVRRTVSWFALPFNAPLGAKCGYRTVDAIWHAAGDRSTDFSFYTKRALLAGVLGAAILYWVDDDSDDHRESWGFVERCIADVLKLPALGARARRLMGNLPDPFRLLLRARRFGPG